jgi:hypothetical protein
MSAEISNGQKLYTVVSRVSLKKSKSKGKAPAYRFLGCGLFETRLEASRAMRAAGGGKDGQKPDLVVFSLPLNCEEDEEEEKRPYQATITVYAHSQQEADDIAADLVIEN